MWHDSSIKVQVSCAKEPYQRDNILQKRPKIWSILLTVATPYSYTSKYILHENTNKMNMQTKWNQHQREVEWICQYICRDRGDEAVLREGLEAMTRSCVCCIIHSCVCDIMHSCVCDMTHRDRGNEAVLRECLEAMVMRSHNPMCVIDVTLQPMCDDGAQLAASVNAAVCKRALSLRERALSLCKRACKTKRSHNMCNPCVTTARG